MGSVSRNRRSLSGPDVASWLLQSRERPGTPSERQNLTPKLRFRRFGTQCRLGRRAIVSSKVVPNADWHGPCWPKSSKSACARRQQRPTWIRSSAPLSPSVAKSELEAPSLLRPTQAPLGPTARTGGAMGEAKGAFHRLEPSLECLSKLSVTAPATEVTDPASALFSRSRILSP